MKGLKGASLAGLAAIGLAAAMFSGLPASAATPVTGQWGWGVGPLGDAGGHATPTGTPQSIQISGDITKIAGGGQADSGRTVYALTTDGRVWNWGRKAVGVDPSNRNLPATVPGLDGVVDIAVGAETAYALKRDGTVWSWGDGTAGARGDGGLANDAGPSQVVGINDAIAISDEALVRADGTVWTWGFHPNGALGSGTNRYDDVPVRVAGLTNIRTIAGYQAVLALSAGGLLFANNSGSISPLGLSGVSVLSVGVFGDALAIANGGHVYQWWPYGGRPALVPGVSAAVAVASSWTTSYALLADGTVTGWGSNDNFELHPLKQFSNVSVIGAGLEVAFAVGNYTAPSGPTTTPTPTPTPRPTPTPTPKPTPCDASFGVNFTDLATAKLTAFMAPWQNCRYLWRIPGTAASSCPGDLASYTDPSVLETSDSTYLSAPVLVTLCAFPVGGDFGDVKSSARSVVSPVSTYAPRVYLAKGEKYFPTSTDEFIENSALYLDKPDVTDPTCNDERVTPLAQPADLPNYQSVEDWSVATTRRKGRTIQTCEDRGHLKSTGTVAKDDVLETGLALHLNNKSNRAGIAPSASSKAYSAGEVPVYVVYKPGVSISYYFFYAYNGWKHADIKELHEGDWEHVVVNLGLGSESDGYNEARDVSYFQHSCPAVTYTLAQASPNPAPLVGDTLHPIVFSASGGHASYPKVQKRAWLCGKGVQGLMDETSKGVQWDTWLTIRDATHEPWWGFAGNWGAADPSATHGFKNALWRPGPKAPQP